MCEYIKREYAVDAVLDVYYDTPDIDLSGEKFEAAIRKIQSADVTPVRHGRWEDKPNPQWKAYDIRYCSACGWSIHKSKLRNADLNWAYCPSCGARMDGGDANA